MSYNSVATFKLNAFPSGSYNSIPDAIIQQNLDEAAADIDSHLRVHHTLPMATGSYSTELANLYRAERIIAGYNLLLYRGLEPSIEGTADNVLITQYQEIMHPTDGFLSQIAKGQILFPQASDSTPSQSEGRPKVYGDTINSSGIRLNSSGYRIV